MVQPIEFHQWRKNGDHPGDGPAEREGKVVRYYRNPQIPGNGNCGHCMHKWHDHGWIDQGKGGGRTVCPGDWIISVPEGGDSTHVEYYPVKEEVRSLMRGE